MIDKLLYVSQTDLPQELVQIFKSAGFSDFHRAKSSNEARRMINSQEFSCVIINAPLPDEFGNELALSLLDNNITNVILLVKLDIREAVEAKLESAGVVVLPKPISPILLYKSLSIFKSFGIKIEKILQKNRKLEEKIEELKIVDRAKCALIIKEGMNEEQAHKHIEKAAMNQRRTRREIAIAILDMYNE